MKKLIFFALFFLTYCLFGQETLTLSANKRLTTPALKRDDNTFDPKDLIVISFTKPKNLQKGGKLYYKWSIQDTKGWTLKQGTTNTNEKLEIYFEKVGNYSIQLDLADSMITTVDGERVAEAIEYTSDLVEEFITVRSVFPELAALYAQKPKPDYVKLVERASEYTVKPKYASDPTPHLFLAKGYFGIASDPSISDPRFEYPINECIESLNTARELDKNGVIFDDEHQMFLSDLENYIFDYGIKSNLGLDANLLLDIKNDPDGFESLSEHIEYYSQISFAPITATFMQAVIAYMNKDVKGANLIWKTSTANLLKYKYQEVETTYGKKFTDELGNTVIMSKVDLQVLKIGIMRSATLMKIRDKNSTKACELLNIIKPWFENDRELGVFINKEFNDCGE